MAFSPAPDFLYQTVHPITGVVTTWTKMIESDLSFGRASGSYAVFSGDGGINPYSGGAAPIKIRTFKFTFIHPYDPGETFTQWRDKVMTACNHGFEMDFYVKCGDGSLRQGHGACNVSDMASLTRDKMVLFQATIEFECVNPYLRDQYESGTLRWDNGLAWDVGHDIYVAAPTARLTAGTYVIAQSGNSTTALSVGARATDVQFALDSATPSPIPYLAYSPANEAPIFNNAAPQYLLLESKTPGVKAALTVTPSGLVGGTMSVTHPIVGSAAATNIWDLSPNRITLDVNPKSLVIVATGNASDREVIIYVDGPIGANYYVYNLSLPGGLFGVMGFAMLEGLAAGEQHQIDIGRQSVRKQVGSNSYSSWPYFYLPPGQEDWFRIDPGTNVLSIQQTTGITTTAQFRASTKAHYL